MDETMPEESGRGGSVQSVDRAMRILEIIGDSQTGCRLNDIARAAHLPASTVHRLLTTLEKGRYVHSDGRGGLWHIGLPLLAIGLSFLDRSSFVAPALPLMRRLRDDTKETVNLGAAYDGEIVILAQVASRQIMRAISRVGGRVPMTASGMGKAILSTFPPDDVEALATLRGVRRRTARQVTDPAALRQELDEIRRCGYALDDHAFRPDVRCIAAVVHGPDAEAVCAVSLSGLSDRIPQERIPMLAAKVQETARAISRAIGGVPV